MSSSSKKLAIINSQNTTKTLKFIERPLPNRKVNDKPYKIVRQRGKSVETQRDQTDIINSESGLTTKDIFADFQSSAASLKFDDDPLVHEDGMCASSTRLGSSLPSRNMTPSSNTEQTNITTSTIDHADYSPSPKILSPRFSSDTESVCQSSATKTRSDNLLMNDTGPNENVLYGQPVSDPAVDDHYVPPNLCVSSSNNGGKEAASPLVLESSISQFKNVQQHSQITSHTRTNPPLITDSETYNEDLSVAEFLAFSGRPVSLNDFLIGGEKISINDRQPNKMQSKLKLLPLTDAKSPTFTTLPHTVHQFCVHTNLPLLPLQLQILSRKVHAHPPSKEWPKMKKDVPSSKAKEGHQEELTKNNDGLELLGVTLPIETDPMKLIWAPAPGKLSLYPSTVQRFLTTQRVATNDTELDESKEEEPVAIEIEEDEHLNEVKQLQHRILFGSSSNINQELEQTQNGEKTEEIDNEGDKEKELDIKKNSIDSHSQFLFIMNEITWQREQLINFHKEILEASRKSIHEEGETDEETVSGSLGGSQLGSSSTFNSTRIMMRRTNMRSMARKGNPSTTAQRHIPLKRTNSAIARSQYLRQEVSKPPQPLKRSVSFPSMKFDQPLTTNDDQKKVDYNPTNIKLRKTSSTPQIICYDELIEAKGIMKYSDPWQSAESIWDEWFYEVLAEVRAAIADLDKGRQPLLRWEPCLSNGSNNIEVPPTRRTKAHFKTKTTTKIEQSLPAEVELADISHLIGIDLQAYSDRMKEINNEIESTEDPKTKATLLNERGSLNRKIGRLSDSMSDFTEALSVYPRISASHWNMHLLYLIQGKEKLAIGELTLLLKKDQNNCLGYQSRGILLAKMGRLDDAIQNYTQAIWLEGGNAKLHFIRAELREKRGEIEAAVSDYSTVVSLDPQNEEALMRQAVHKYNRKLWRNTTQLLSNLLIINQNRVEAWLLRSQAYLNIDKHDFALRDLSAAIHLNPNNSKLYYQRGCLLRSQDPVRALKDFSITLLLSKLNSSAALAYLHRGVVYSQLKCMDEALSDFLMAVHLDSFLSSAHTNAGLIIMKHERKPGKAIKHFTAGMLADPTYIRALLCRAEAYTKLEEYGKAILDWTRAIHYSPDNPSYHLNQGKVFLKMKDYSNALFCIRTSSNLGGSVGSAPAQQALVYAFLGDHNKAISRLQAVIKNRRGINLYTVLGKVQLRARMFSDAANSFNSAIEYINFSDPYLTSEANKSALTNLRYMSGRSLLGARNFKKAAEQFSQVLSMDPTNALAYYDHGLALLKHGNSKGMTSINHSIMLKPDLTEGYLTRAAYYGKVCRFSKAILNCAEAIKLQPKSSRAYLCRGVLRHKMGYHTTAIADLSMAVTISPALSSIALFNRGICYQAIGDAEKALRDYSTMCLMEGTHLYQVLVNRGLLYLDISDYRNAVLDLTQASEIQSDDPKLWQTIGFCHHKLGELHKAVRSYSKAIELNPSFYEAYVGRGNAYAEFLTKQGNDEARSDYCYVIENNSKCLAAQLNLALLHQCEGRHMLAWENITTLLENHKDYVPALEARAIISLQNMNTFGALLDINRAILLEPSANLYVERGVIYQYMKDVYNAVKDFDKAISMDPHLAIAYYNLGNVLLQQKLYRQAIDRYSKVIDLVEKGNRDEALVNRGICHVAVGDDTKAISDFNSAIKANPFAAHGYFNRANLLKRSGKLSAAEQDYRRALSLYPSDPVSLNYHGYTLSLLGNSEESRKQFFKAAL